MAAQVMCRDHLTTLMVTCVYTKLCFTTATLRNTQHPPRRVHQVMDVGFIGFPFCSFVTQLSSRRCHMRLAALLTVTAVTLVFSNAATVTCDVSDGLALLREGKWRASGDAQPFAPTILADLVASIRCFSAQSDAALLQNGIASVDMAGHLLALALTADGGERGMQEPVSSAKVRAMMRFPSYRHSVRLTVDVVVRDLSAEGGFHAA